MTSVEGTLDYQDIFEHGPDALILLDGKGRLVAANDAACDLTGYARHELLRIGLRDLVVPEERKSLKDHLATCVEAGQAQRSSTLVRKDGTRIIVDSHMIALGEGLLQAALRDVTERVALQKSLERSRYSNHMLIDLCHSAIIAADDDGRIISWNKSASELFGYTTTETIGTLLTRIIPARLKRSHRSAFQRHVGGKIKGVRRFLRRLVTQGLRKDGSEIFVEVSIAVGQLDERPVFIAVVRDLTEHQAVVDRLNNALQQLQFHVERMPLAYIVWDTDFITREWNPAAERIFGYVRKEAIGRHPYDLIVPPDAISTVQRVWNDLLQGDTSSHSINANVRKDGSRLTCEWFNTPLRDSSGSICGVASMAMDISEREELEAQLRNRQKLESLGVLAGGVAHDFNSSLTVILGNSALIRSMKDVPAKAVAYLELLEEAALRASQLIKHLLTYARTGRYSPQSTDLNAVVRDAVKFVGSSLGPDHDLDLHLAPRLPAILADHSQIEQIILNLCLNAMQAKPGGGTIVLTIRETSLSPRQAARCVPNDARAGRYVELEVRDDGCGMDEATVARMFDPFFTTKPEGHGLGMAAVLGILRQHQAVAQVESSPGKGTAVHVYFPVLKNGVLKAAATSTTKERATRTRNGSRSKGKRTKQSP